MFKEVETRPDFVALEHRILAWWEEEAIFRKLVDKNRGNQTWSFQDGPITANNPMGVHHAWGRTYKDIYHRYHAMLGRDIRYQNGFDCQGLWVEVEVERELGFKSKRDIEAYGVADFVQRCKDRVHKYAAIQAEQSKRLAYWMDWDHSYFTLWDSNNYTIWLFLKRCHERGFIYRGADVMPWCSRCSVGLSEHEIATDGYRDMVHTSLVVRFPLRERPNEGLLVWTTTPWTLTSNVAAAVHPDLTYARVKQGDRIHYLSQTTLPMLKGAAHEILGTVRGSELVGLTYDGPFDELEAQAGVGHKVIPWEEVSEAEGTGIVHIAPGCGREDYALAPLHGLAVIAPLDEFGLYVKGFGPFVGLPAGDVADMVTENLKQKGILYSRTPYQHRYPVCWRCGTELVFRLVDEWYIRMDELRHEIMDVARKITWKPSFGLDQELNWLENMHDWMISKKRYWGLALPIYPCPDCGEIEVLGGKDELKARAIEGWEEFEGHSPHKPWIDRVKIACKRCGAKVSRIEDVGNPWLDAGIVPFSTISPVDGESGYIQHRDYWERWFPADFITECFPGQFRNWFYSLLAMSTVLEHREPFKVVLGHALVKDEQGNEMHKSQGNAIWFDDAAEQMGVDTMRWLFTTHNPFMNLNFGYGPGREVRKKLITLWNVYSFFATYARIDEFDPTATPPPVAERSDLDRFLLAKLRTLIERCRAAYEAYEVLTVTREAEEFIDILSNWYVRRSRRRFWKSENDSDKLSAYFTLHEALLTFIRVIAPIVPLVTEAIYRNLAGHIPGAAQSIHLTSFPEVDPSLKDEALVEETLATIRIVEAGRSARMKANLKIRQPLSRVLIRPGNPAEERAARRFGDQIKEELNVKAVEVLEGAEGLISHRVRLNHRALGPRLGKRMKEVERAVAEMPGFLLAKRHAAGEDVMLHLESGIERLAPGEFEVESVEAESYSVREEGEMVVAVDTRLSEELLAEGMARDFVRHVQALRKDAGFAVEDRIFLSYETSSERLSEALESFRSYIQSEVLATTWDSQIKLGEIEGQIKIAKEDVRVALKRAKTA